MKDKKVTVYVDGKKTTLSTAQLSDIYKQAKTHFKRSEHKAIIDMPPDRRLKIEKQYEKIISELIHLHDMLPLTIKQNPDNDVRKSMRKISKFVAKIQND